MSTTSEVLDREVGLGIFLDKDDIGIGPMSTSQSIAEDMNRREKKHQNMGETSTEKAVLVNVVAKAIRRFEIEDLV